ncbi:hypothetical protein CDIK_2033 [Cucumispora dikerogammari]|nr:hypothetical protein CDIK_2033 [Cucumispora dikerogammari]
MFFLFFEYNISKILVIGSEWVYYYIQDVHTTSNISTEKKNNILSRTQFSPEIKRNQIKEQNYITQDLSTECTVYNSSASYAFGTLSFSDSDISDDILVPVSNILENNDGRTDSDVINHATSSKETYSLNLTQNTIREKHIQEKQKQEMELNQSSKTNSLKLDNMYTETISFQPPESSIGAKLIEEGSFDYLLTNAFNSDSENIINDINNPLRLNNMYTELTPFQPPKTPIGAKLITEGSFDYLLTSAVNPGSENITNDVNNTYKPIYAQSSKTVSSITDVKTKKDTSSIITIDLCDSSSSDMYTKTNNKRKHSHGSDKEVNEQKKQSLELNNPSESSTDQYFDIYNTNTNHIVVKKSELKYSEKQLINNNKQVFTSLSLINSKTLDTVPGSDKSPINIKLKENPRIGKSYDKLMHKSTENISVASKNECSVEFEYLVTDGKSQKTAKNTDGMDHGIHSLNQLHLKKGLKNTENTTVEHFILTPRVISNPRLDQIERDETYCLFFLKVNETIKTRLENDRYVKKVDNHPLIKNIVKIEKDSSFEINYTIVNIPLMLFDLCFTEFSKLASIKLTNVRMLSNLLHSADVSFTFLKTKKLYLQEIIPNLSNKFTSKSFCKYYVCTIEFHKFPVKNFNIQETLTMNIHDRTGLKPTNIFYTDPIDFNCLVRDVIYTFNNFSNAKDSDLLSLINIRSLLSNFGAHLKEMMKIQNDVNFIHVVIKIYKALLPFKREITIIRGDIGYTKLENEMLSLYVTILKNYVPFAELIIDIYNIYIRNSEDDILQYW